GSSLAGDIAEMDEVNNEAIASFMVGDPVETIQSVQGTSPSSDLPNLVFQNVAVSPEAGVGVGQSVTFNASIANMGAQPSGSFMLTLQWTTPTGASYTLVAQRVASLNPGEAWNIPAPSIQTSLPMGHYAIIGILDGGNEVAESNESDNELIVAVPVGQGEGIQPDLTPISVRFVPSTAIVESGQEILVYTTIQNSGALAAGSFAVEVSAGDIISRETWPGLEPLASIELVHTLGTPAPGSYQVAIQVDALEQVVESNEANNARLESLQIAAPEQNTVERVIGGQGSVVSLSLDASTGTLYGAWSNGTIRATDRNGGDLVTYDAGVALTTMIAVFGVQDVGYVGTEDGRILGIDLSTGSLLVESTALGSGVRALISGSSGVLYAATTNQLVQLNYALLPIAQTSMVGTVVDLGFEPVRGAVYALTTTGLYAFDSALSAQCSVTDFIGVPTTLAIGDTGVFVGTSSGILRAFTFCQNVGSSSKRMLDAWRYPRSSSLGSQITSITIDARDIDPIYVTTDVGSVHSLDFTGNLLWTYQRSQSGIHSIPAIDDRSGRLFYVDDEGVPSILDVDGSKSFSINSDLSQGSAVGSNLIVDEVRRQTESGTRLFRIYYFGTDDGWIYKVESIR
ncbi:hypothetical protein KAH43_07285, partial [Candidatus Bipolaricaulota bacterium]|nr:hypothetical protein [Candidatus Bipolaricaulota bacterium]